MKTSQKRWWDFTAAFLLLVAFIIIAYRVNDTKWADGLRIIIPLTLIGCLLGVLLGYSKFNRANTWWIGLVYSLFFIPWQIALLAPDTFSWGERVQLMAHDLWIDLNIFLANKPLSDSYLFILLMSILLWVNSLTTTFALVRKGKPWQGLIVGGTIMVVVDIYHPKLAAGGVATAVYAVIALVLITRIFYLKQAEQWREEQVAEDSDTGASLVRVTFLVGIILVFLAWKAPTVVKAFVPDSPENAKLVNSWQAIRKRIENVTAPLRGSIQDPVEYFADNYSLGTGSVLTDQTIFTVSPSVRPYSGVSYYWRMRSYDTYQDGQWSSTLSDSLDYSPGVKFVYNQYAGRTQVEFKITPAKNLSMLYSPGLFVSGDQKANLLVDRTNGLLEDVTSVLINPVFKAGETYNITDSISTATVAAMTNAGTDYPDWVTENYLQLPDDFPSDIRDLAQNVTAGLSTPYEKANAITDWLRDNIQYSAQIPDPPPGIDPMEWMLFDEKQAFCNYYASAEVLLLRSLGVPARWVVGYAQGEQIIDTSTNTLTYRVRDKDRHAWPEVFFPGLGWIEFEPTAVQPSLTRPSGDVTGDNVVGNQGPQNLPRLDTEIEPPSGLPPDSPQNTGFFSSRYRVLYATSIILGVLVLLIAGFFIFGRRARKNPLPENRLPVILERTFIKHGWKSPALLTQWSYYTQLSPIERTFYWISYLRLFLGIQSATPSTPSEQIRELARLIPESATPGHRLLREYEKGVYSPHPANVDVAIDAVQKLWKLAIAYRVHKVTYWITHLGSAQQA